MDKDSDQDNEGSKTSPSNRQEVEVLYADDMWYRGWLSLFNFQTGKWIVKDNKTMEVNYPDEEVRIVN